MCYSVTNQVVMTNNDRLDDEIVINGEVYVRKSQAVEQTSQQPQPPAGSLAKAAVESIQEKLARKKRDDSIQNTENDKPDGFPMTLQAIKQKLR